jgi:hypothetical protein
VTERRLAAVLVFALAIGVAPSVAPAIASHVPPSCALHVCSTLDESLQVRVFNERSRPGHVTFDSSFAEWLPSRRVTPLGDFAESVEALRVTRSVLTGRWLGYVLEDFSEQDHGYMIYRLNVRTGQREHVRATPASEGEFVATHSGVSDMAETSMGTVAWIEGGSVASPDTYRVFEWPPGAKAAVLLATATDIAATSLAAVPGHLYWLEGSVPRTANVR